MPWTIPSSRATSPLYNETEGTGILPTPVIGGVGLLDPGVQPVGLAWDSGATLLLVGDTAEHLGSSLYLRELCGREDGGSTSGRPRRGTPQRRLRACADPLGPDKRRSRRQRRGSGWSPWRRWRSPLESVSPLSGDDTAPHAFWFGEDQARYLLATHQPDAVIAAAGAVPVRCLGRTGGDELTVAQLGAISLTELRRPERDVAAGLYVRTRGGRCLAELER